MIEFFVKRPVTTVMFVGVFMVLGLVSIFNLNIEETPKIDFPIVTVEAYYPGATPYEVETQIINKIEDEIAEISEIKKIESDAYEGFGFVIIEFILSADVNTKSIEVKDKVDGIINDFPEGAEKPIIKKFDPLVQPVINLALTSDAHDERDLYEYADKTFKNILSRIEGVASVDIFGGRERQINVKLDPLLMKQYYISIDDVVDRIRAQNKNVPSGSIDQPGNSLSIRLQGEFASVDALSEMIMTSVDGTQFKLKDIAKVEDGFRKIDSMARFNRRSVVNLAVKKVSDGNAVNIARAVTKKMPEFRKIIPEGMDIEIASDTTEFIVGETKDAGVSIAGGILLTALILYLFTGQVKRTFISSIVIPTSVISTFFLMDNAGFTINMMTLLAIATSLGTLIANAIVIIEHVLERLEEGDVPEQAAVRGTQRCAAALVASTGTNLVVFTPIAFMGGIVGQFMKSFGLTVVFATVFSLVASFSLTPMLCAVMLRKFKARDKAHAGSSIIAKSVDSVDRFVEFLRREYQILLGVMFRFPKTTLILAVLSLYCIKFILPFVGNEFYPASDQNQVRVSVAMPQGSTIERTDDTVKLIEERLQTVPEAESVLSTIGENGIENASVTVNLISAKDRKRSDVDIINELIPFTAKIPDAEIEYSQFGGMDEADMTINVRGIDYKKMVVLSERMLKIMEDSGFFRSTASSHKYPKTEIRFIPDEEKMASFDITNDKIGNLLRTSIYGDDTNTYKEDGEEYKLNVEIDAQYKDNILDIFEINAISRKGLIPITELGSIEARKAIPTIKHRDKNRVIVLTGYLSKSTAGYVQQVLDKAFSEIEFEDGYGYAYAGKAEFQEESGREISKAFLIAVILTFMLLAAVLNSYVYPISIVSTVATSFVGVFLFLFFLDKSINISSMLGIVMLVGLVVNGAILLVEYAIHLMQSGKELLASIKEAADVRFRPILLTALAIVFGTLPQLWSVVPLKNAMAAVIIGGILAATFFTFTTVPVFFWYSERFRRYCTRNR